MDIAALVLWILTALGGFYLLAKWVAGGGHRQTSATKFPPGVIFSHFTLAAAGLVLWIIYLATGNTPVGWVALIVLAPVAALGLAMFARWIPTYRSSRSAVMAGGSATAEADAQAPPERSFPVVVVGAHGVLAVTTVVLVLLADLHVGGS
jgi:manganese efflux pump family protein